MNLNYANIYNRPSIFALNNHKNNKAPNFQTVSFSGQELITPEVTQKLEQIGKEIETADKIAVFTHASPDGDAVGSAAALKNLIATKYPDKKVDVFIMKGIPQGHKCLKDTESFEYINDNSDINSINARNYNLAIAVDCAEKRMMDQAADVFDSAERKIKIDHHPDREQFADINLTCPEASCASQVVLLLAEAMKVPLNQNLASDIYLAMVTDTQGFRYMSKPTGVFEDASKLTKAGFDERKVYCSAMDYMPKESLRLYADALKNIKYSEDGKIAYVVDDDTLNKDGVRKSDIKDIFNKVVGVTMPNIEGVEVAVKLTQRGNTTSGSLRSNGKIIVNDLAEKLGGGGHKFAAGFQPIDNKSPSEVFQDIVNHFNNKI